ncbi:hypothetical protein K491DRAFT_718755 [Lophiostoma macrostomum CBS 122681]|uniref:CCHC-type domain-containing protein n=1 Tax=Lophiostoma macrostomum CBS 122681 TaxID=1314788 RepID=A0A6A6SY14_9PLEO|nr:hypothetical protein K491DRAFT_718755 [Lophiostoma macrostomum CBS 122681]
MAANTPKTMSSRLMTMKFMQRSAAKSASDPSTPDGRPSKRARLSNGTSAPNTPGTPSDHEAMQSALAAEERKRQEAIDKAVANSGETKWVLSYKDNSRPQGMRVVHAGFAAIDADEDGSEEDEFAPPRMQFGGGVRKKKPEVVSTKEEGTSEDESDSDAATDSSDYDSDDPAAELIRQTKREAAAKDREVRKAQKKKAAAKLPPKPPTAIADDLDFRKVISLSGSGSASGPAWRRDAECFNCGEKGHLKSDCPKPLERDYSGRGGRGGRGRGSSRK